MHKQILNVFVNKLQIKGNNDRPRIFRFLFNRALQLYCPHDHILQPDPWDLPARSSLDHKLGEELMREFSSDMKNLVFECIDAFEAFRKQPLQHADIVHLQEYNTISFKGKPIEFESKPFLFLDIDGTLMYSNRDANSVYDHRIAVNNQEMFVRLRPHLSEFLEKARSSFNLVLYTAANCLYAERVAEVMGGNFDLILDRSHCLFNVLFYFKDIRILNVDLKRAVIIDNEKRSFAVTPENGILIKDFNGDKGDTELLKMMDIIEKLAEAEDVRDVISEISK